MGQRLYRHIDELRQRLHCPDPWKRMWALRALGETRAPRAREALVGALQAESRQMRARALLSLWQGEQSVPTPEARALLTDPDEHVRAMAVRFAPDLLGPAAASELMRHLDDPSPKVRSSAVDSLAELRHAPALPLLRRLLADPESMVQAAACHALGKLGDEKSVEALAARAETDENTYTRYQAAEALLRLGDPRGAERLRRMAEAGEAPDFLSLERFRLEVRCLLATGRTYPASQLRERSTALRQPASSWAGSRAEGAKRRSMRQWVDRSPVVLQRPTAKPAR